MSQLSRAVHYSLVFQAEPYILAASLVRRLAFTYPCARYLSEISSHV